LSAGRNPLDSGDEIALALKIQAGRGLERV
jgi:hypothetical protein